MESFTQEERAILANFVTDIDKDVFVLTNLPEVIKGALFSRYSRSTKSLRRLLIDEFLKDPQSGLAQLQVTDSGLRDAVRKAQAFYDRVLDGYGDDSVGELGGAHVAIENVSMIGTKIIQDARLGGSPLEKSTRYVWFDQKVDGDYLFYKEPAIMASPHKDRYLATCRMLFDTYAQLVNPVTEKVKEHFPLERFGFFDITTKAEIPYDAISDEKVRKRAQIAYAAAVRAKACDMLRGLLPASTLTNMGVYGNGRFFQGLLSKLYTTDLAEAHAIGKEMHAQLDKIIPSFVRRAKRDPYLVASAHKTAAFAQEVLGPSAHLDPRMVRLVCHGSEDDLLMAIAFSQSRLPLPSLREKVKRLSPSEQDRLIQSYVGERKTRRDKPGRAFEHLDYTFEIVADFGLYRDLQRHRVLTQERQLLTADLGFELPHELVHFGLAERFERAMAEAKECFDHIAKDMPAQAQYVVPLAYKLRWYMRMNLREAIHLIELRSTPQGHPAYRKVAQLMFKEIERATPRLAAIMRFVDMNEYPLGRLSSEMKSEEKRAARENIK